FPEDKDIPKDALNGKIDETFVPLAKVKLPKEGDFSEWKKGLLKNLREMAFRRFPERIPAADARPLRTPHPAGWPVTTEPGIELLIWPFPKAQADERDGTMIVLDGEDKLKTEDDLKNLLEWAKPYGTRGPVVILPPRGTGKSEWTRKSPPNYV